MSGGGFSVVPDGSALTGGARGTQSTNAVSAARILFLRLSGIVECGLRCFRRRIAHARPRTSTQPWRPLEIS
jgi:hypothetical protein